MVKRTVEERIQRLEDVRQIENLMARYAYLHTAGRHEETAKLFATKTPGVRAEIGRIGRWEGTEGIYKAMVKNHEFMGVGSPGGLFVHPQTTPVIEVSGDGKTAKGVWMSPGLETRRNPESGKLVGYWLWGNYGVDFVKEDGKWKFWHFHVYTYIMTPYEKSWTESTAYTGQPIPEDIKPDRPGTSNTMYSLTAEIKYNPVPPEPYQTFDENNAY